MLWCFFDDATWRRAWMENCWRDGLTQLAGAALSGRSAATVARHYRRLRDEGVPRGIAPRQRWRRPRYTGPDWIGEPSGS
jgi:hypothetical protein